MFTGIITDIGHIKEIKRNEGLRLTVTTTYDTRWIKQGASIACSGTCLTVVAKGSGWFTVDVSEETLRCTTIKYWKEGQRINLERALNVGDELGGHMVYGHVDGIAEVVTMVPEGDSYQYIFKIPAEWLRFLAKKGSVAIDGVSLTISDVKGDECSVNVIPHTVSQTTFKEYVAGSKVNLEIDMVARYIERIVNFASK